MNQGGVVFKEINIAKSFTKDVRAEEREGGLVQGWRQGRARVALAPVGR